MMNHTRILVALSPTAGHDAAFERGLALAKASGAELYLLQAVPTDLPYSYRAAERLRRGTALRERAEAAGVAVMGIEQHGDPADLIVLHAEALSVDLIVMGTEGRTGWALWREPSVAERVLRETTRPALVVRDDDTAAAFERVVAAVDLSPASTGVIDAALRYAAGDGHRVSVMHVVNGVAAAGDVLSQARWIVPEYRGYMLDAARRRLGDFVPATGYADVELHVAGGPAVDAIRAYVADVDADLIVLGGSQRVMHLGSTAARIVRYADRAVLVVPPAVAV